MNAEIKVSQVIGDHMVLQRHRPIPIWGKAASAERVVVSMNGVNAEATAGQDGRWEVELPAMEASGPFVLEIKGRNSVVIDDVLVGDVWFAGGQSNMEFPLYKALNGEHEAAAANFPQIRLFDAKQVVSPYEPKDDVEGKWEVCSPITAGQFSAVAYHFAREVQQEEGVPIGIVESSCSWTPAESWLSRDALAADPELNGNILKRWDEIEASYPQDMQEYAERIKSWQEEKENADANGKEAPPQPKSPLDPCSIHRAAGLWNGSVAPFLPYAIRGVIWYQGETNDNRGHQYRKLFPALISDWRKKWRQPDLPFFWVQLANVLPPDQTPIESEWAEVREAQLMSLKLPHTGMAVAIDAGEEDDVHPRNKKDIGHRLALAALAKAYGKDVDYSGPIFKSMRVEKGEARVSFDHVNTGLVTPDDAPVKGFALAGDDRKYEFARARIEGDQIIVWNDELPEPVAVRYAWANNPAGANLYSRTRGGELLPASPFRSDDWPGKSFGVTKLVSE
ncbi:MAG TPA: sialate O-acetylesterase [Terrimicrobiaceae bacterium]